MMSGFDRYYQIVKCFRDEDLRADRQPEFTQIDAELSFVDIEDIMDINERLIKNLYKEVQGIDIKTPFQRMPYKEAMERFGSDKPDIRFDMELVDISDTIKYTDFVVFKSALDAGGSVRGINAKNCGTYPRKKLDGLIEFVKDFKAKGLAYIIINEDGTYKTSISKFFTTEQLDEIVKVFNGEKGDLILICADASNQVVFDSLGNLRLEIAKNEGLTDENALNFLWVTEFPLLEWDEDANRFFAKHHPFTSVMEEDIPLLDDKTKLQDIRAKAYDLVLNGVELMGGSIRINTVKMQETMFNLLGFTKEEIDEKFGFFTNALKYGAPPHGGMAYGLDRLTMLMTGEKSIRDVMAFPKVKDTSCPLTNAPSTVDSTQLDEFGMRFDKIISKPIAE